MASLPLPEYAEAERRRKSAERKETLRSALDNVTLTEAREVCAEYGFVPKPSLSRPALFSRWLGRES
jgi:hypothetical protein